MTTSSRLVRTARAAWGRSAAFLLTFLFCRERSLFSLTPPPGTEQYSLSSSFLISLPDGACMLFADA